MMRLGILLIAGLVFVFGCQSNPDRNTIGKLRQVEPDMTEVQIDESLIKAMASYQRFLDETPGHAMAPEAMRRLADLQIEKEYGIIGDGAPPSVIELPAPEQTSLVSSNQTSTVSGLGKNGDLIENDAEFELRASAPDILGSTPVETLALPEGQRSPDATAGPRQAIATYEKILSDYPWYERNDQVLYQMARAYDELGQPDEAMAVVERLIGEYSHSRYLDEVFFRRGEYHFVRRKYLDAEEAYLAVVRMGEGSPFYELALYKLGWSFYKQELYEEALHQYIALLDYKLSTGYDFDADYARENEGEERRVADTFRVISLSFSNLGGPEELNAYFSNHGGRSYEDRIYQNLAEFHFDKRRFNDAAETYKAFVALNPLHRISPHFGMRVSEIYAEGNFPLLVVESKKDFANRYGIEAGYWQHFDQAERPEVLDYLKTNLIDLAGHYHALYQEESLREEQPENYSEALNWYNEFLASFPEDEQSPGINYQLADLLLEHGDFGESARQYERTAYDYPAHQRAPEAGYAAIYAHRQHLETVDDDAEVSPAKLATVESSLRFAETFPDHEHAATVLGAAAEDLYAMQDYERAISSGRWLIGTYQEAPAELLRTTWQIVAHASFDTALYADAENGYAEVLALTDQEDEARQSVVDNLAAAIYKQGEQARAEEDYIAAAGHFLRVKSAAPSSEIRPSAEYDAAAALIHLEDWLAAAEVLEDFRSAFPEHELNGDATRQLAVVYENAGELARSAAEYEQVAHEADDPAVRREAILIAGDLYEQADSENEALRVYEGYIDEFPEPLETALEIRFKLAGMYDARGFEDAYLEHLRAIVDIDARAGEARSDRTRYLAAQSALVLSQQLFAEFTALPLTQPFEESLAAKKILMNEALAVFESLVGYGVGEVTAAATYYLAEIYGHFSDALIESERPAGLSTAELAAYEMVIEEEAFPFEEQSIAVHQENLELVRVGVFNDWVQRSLDELAVLMPARYAKSELSSGFVGTIDQYAYHSPLTPESEAHATDQEVTMRKGAEPADELAGVSHVQN